MAASPSEAYLIASTITMPCPNLANSSTTSISLTGAAVPSPSARTVTMPCGCHAPAAPTSWYQLKKRTTGPTSIISDRAVDKVDDGLVAGMSR